MCSGGYYKTRNSVNDERIKYQPVESLDQASTKPRLAQSEGPKD
ncbi:hypothetical protein L798_04347 [Zootermopsis nevadensis]|uniref:Uncharacterized protein n=1 Tax=Zootermopsis nevadensis TaxID=136037 RepID=A0A067RWW4_ZOONE|nr:hypothetical protein L798_04347 [Zootermopsis nevadensis]